MRDAAAVRDAVAEHRPEVVLHLAAQPLVRRSFGDPRRDLRIERHGHRQRARGRARHGARARGRHRHHRQVSTRTASGSGAIARTSRWAATTRTRARRAARSSSPPRIALVLRAPTAPRVASARAGNVIGGGDWGEDRLIPDIMRAALAGEPVRDPQPRRDPPVAARAQPAQRLPACSPRRCASRAELADGWNFGPAERRRAAGRAGSSSG